MVDFDAWKARVVRCLYPPVCLLCGAPGQESLDLCQGCQAALPHNPIACWHCGIPLETPGICGRCQQRPPSFDMVVAPYQYQAPMEPLITGLKFHGQLSHAPLLATLLAKGVKARLLPIPEMLLPVPMHPQRLRQRGFNQALEIARELSRQTAIPLRWDFLRRCRPTPPQSGLDERARRRNLRNAFQLTDNTVYRHVALVDDVMTTGSTVETLAQLLKQHGTDTVSVWVCARTPKH